MGKRSIDGREKVNSPLTGSRSRHIARVFPFTGCVYNVRILNEVNSRSHGRGVGWDLVITKAAPHSDPRLLMTNLGIKPIDRAIGMFVPINFITIDRISTNFVRSASFDSSTRGDYSLDITVSTISTRDFLFFKIEIFSNFTSILGEKL